MEMADRNVCPIFKSDYQTSPHVVATVEGLVYNLTANCDAICVPVEAALIKLGATLPELNPNEIHCDIFGITRNK